MELRTQQARRFYRRRGEFSPACGVCVCRMRAACGGHGGLPLGSATHFHSVAIATQPVHRLQIRPIMHNQGASPTTPPSYIRVRAIMWACGRGQTHRHISRGLRLTRNVIKGRQSMEGIATYPGSAWFPVFRSRYRPRSHGPTTSRVHKVPRPQGPRPRVHEVPYPRCIIA